MADKPTDLPEWATTEEVDPVSGQSNRVEPPTDKKDTGWDRREIPPRQWLNWLLWVISKWVGWLDAGTSSATGDTLVERDANGRTQVATPSADADVATKGYVESYTDAAVDDLSGVTDTATARANLDVYSTSEAADVEEVIVELGGDFDAGQEVKMIRAGGLVTITAYTNPLLTHSGSEYPTSGPVIPSGMRSSIEFANVGWNITEQGLYMTRNTNSDTIRVSRRSFDGTPSGGTVSHVLLSYNI